MDLTPLTEHQLLVFWTQFLVLLLAARALGALMRLLRQPTVIGELAAGVLLGPSVLGAVAPGMSDWLFPADDVQSAMLLTVGWIGVFLLLIDTGFETDLTLIRSLGRAAVRTTTGSLVVPLAIGVVLGLVVPSTFVGAHDDRLTFTLFVASAISISALAVMAKVLTDLKLTRRNVGQLMLASGMANDAFGWLLLGAIAGFATSEELTATELLLPLVGMGIFLFLAFTVGQRAVDFALRSLRRFDAGITGSLTVTFVVALAAGSATQAIGTEAVLGGFVAGVLLGRSKFQRPETRPHLEGITASVFAPIFFATAGLRVDLQLLEQSTVAQWAAIVSVVAFAAKFLGGFIGARTAALPRREAVALGLGLNCRGTLEIVIATVGLSLEIFNEASYTVILVMVLFTTTLAPPLLRATVAGWPGTAEEQERLGREEELAKNVLVRSERILVPSRGGASSRLVARIMNLAWPPGVEATVLSVSRNASRPDVEGVVAAFRGRPVERAHTSSDEPVDAVLRHAALGYGVIGAGALDRPTNGDVLSPLVDGLLARSTLPMVVVRRALTGGDETKVTFRRIMVPAVGTRTARAAQEVAFAVAAALQTEVVIVHVASKPGSAEAATAAVAATSGADDGMAAHRRRRLPRMFRRSETSEPRATAEEEPAAARVVRVAMDRAEQRGVTAKAMFRESTDTAEALVRCAKEIDADLVVLGTSIREVDGRPFLGHAVEQILEQLEATIVLVTAPRVDTA